jgi:acetolactate synthase-1/2/3 large subunit
MDKKCENSGSVSTLNSQQSTQPISVVEAVVKMLEKLGVTSAFGLSGGAVAPLWAALTRSSIPVLHFRHESGAAFAACEAYLANNRPVAVFTTTGPGITNALTGLFAARWEGAKVIFLSGATSTPQRDKSACQETTINTMPADIFSSGKLFHYATIIESANQLPEIARRLDKGLKQLGGFVAHLSIPAGVQTSASETPLSISPVTVEPVIASEKTIARCAELLSVRPFAIWVGFGARQAAESIFQLAKKTGAAVMCSPRGKGIFPENHPQFVGVTGFGGHQSVLTYMQEFAPERMLVLGTDMGELTSFWNPVMVPKSGFIQVDIDPEVLGVAYPSAETVCVQSDIGAFVEGLLKYFANRPAPSTVALPQPYHSQVRNNQDGPVLPDVLFDAIQRIVVEGSDAIVMTEAGNSLAWGNHWLQFAETGRYRASLGFASMGHFATGVVGAALARNGKAVAIIGDGTMLMNSEISTAAKYQIPAVWIVLNDGRYGMCEQGMALQGFKDLDARIPETDFEVIARGMGADSSRVEKESELEEALQKAMKSSGPFVLDVVIDPTVPAPIGARIKSLVSQGSARY